MAIPIAVRAGLSCALATVALALAGPATVARADSVRDLEWYLTTLDMPAAWEITRGAGVVVAMLETGTPDAGQPDLAGAILPGTDLTGVAEVADHATSMAALIAARGRGGDGLIGLAPAAMILPVVTNDTASMAAGFRWATDNGADVINCSCSLGLDAAPAVRDAIGYALEHDVVVVAAAGNSGGAVEVPARYDGVIAVSGLTQQDRLTDVSSRGPEVDMAAPAGDFPVAVLNGEYLGTNGGTSGAAALMSGVVALVRAAHPDLDAANVVNRVVSTARDIGPAGVDDEFGYGAVDPVAALTADVALVTANPLGTPGGAGKGESADGGASATPPRLAAATPVVPDPPATTAAPAAAATSEPAVTRDPCASESADCGTGLSGAGGSSGSGVVGIPLAVGAAVLVILSAGVGVLVARRRLG